VQSPHQSTSRLCKIRCFLANSAALASCRRFFASIAPLGRLQLVPPPYSHRRRNLALALLSNRCASLFQTPALRFP
jgi:hypothetical protein